MSKVIKRGGMFELAEEPEKLALSAARSGHFTDTEILTAGKCDLNTLAAILLHLLQRIKALEEQTH